MEWVSRSEIDDYLTVKHFKELLGTPDHDMIKRTRTGVAKLVQVLLH